MLICLKTVLPSQNPGCGEARITVRCPYLCYPLSPKERQQTNGPSKNERGHVCEIPDKSRLSVRVPHKDIKGSYHHTAARPPGRNLSEPDWELGNGDGILGSRGEAAVIFEG